MKTRNPQRLLREHQGYSLVELLVAMLIGLVVSLAAFAVLDFTASDVTRVAERTHVDQAARIALANLMVQLHSACVAPTVTPVLPGSSATSIRFISEVSPLNERKEPVSALATVREHEILYTPPVGKVLGTLTEKSWPSSGTSPEFKFNTAEAVPSRKLLNGITQTEVKAGEPTPVFQYYRYSREANKLGQLSETKMPVPLVKEEEAEEVAKVTISFTVVPEGRETNFAKGDRAVALEDSAVLRLAPSSESSENPNLPCTQQT